jgi:hypothetical protein
LKTIEMVEPVEPLLAPDLETIITKYKILFIYYIILKINKVDSI